MRARAGVDSAVVAMVASLLACSVTPSPAPPIVPSSGPSIAAAPASPPASSAPSAVAPTPGPSANGWIQRGIPEFTTTGGADLASSVDGATEFVHVVASNLEEALPGGFDASVYVRTRSEGQAWGDRLLIEGMDPRMAAAGANVYVAFFAYRCGGIGVLRNSNHGSHGAWSTLKCLTRNRSSVDSSWAPTIAATDRLVYVAYVDEVSLHAMVRVSRDRGGTWSKVDLGAAAPSGEAEVIGPVEAAATGQFAVVAWSNRGQAVARVSVDGGSHWGKATTLGTGGVTSAAGRESRLVVGGAGDGSWWAQMWTESTGWSVLAQPDPPPGFGAISGVNIALGAGTSLGVIYASCGEMDDTRWLSSPDGGVTWTELDPLPRCAGKMLWTVHGTTYVLASGGDEGYTLAVHP